MESFCLGIVSDARILGHAQIVLGPRAHPACAQIIRLDASLACQFSLSYPSGAPLVLSQSWVGGRPECVGVSSRTHGAQNRHYAEKRRRPWATEGWSSVMVWRISRWSVECVKLKCYLLKPGLFSWVSVVQWWKRARWVFHSAGHHWICAPPLALWPHNRPDCRLLQVSNSVLFQASFGFLLVLMSSSSCTLRYADLSIVALSSRLDGVEQHHADK